MTTAMVATSVFSDSPNSRLRVKIAPGDKKKIININFAVLRRQSHSIIYRYNPPDSQLQVVLSDAACYYSKQRHRAARNVAICVSMY